MKTKQQFKSQVRLVVCEKKQNSLLLTGGKATKLNIGKE